MAKYNLLDDDDIFGEKKDNTEDENVNPSPEESTDIDINIDKDDFELEPTSLEDEEFQTDISTESIPEEEKPEGVSSEYDEDPHFEDNEEESYEKEKSSLPSYMVDDYEDDKQEGINYKPFLKIIVVILVLVGIYFVVDYFILSDSEPVVEEPIKTEEQLRQEQEAARKAEFISSMSGKLNSDIQQLNSTIADVVGSAKVSSILYYGNSFLCEVFGSDRAEVARVNMAFKKSGKNFEVISSQTRPGSKGGVLSLYKLDAATGGGVGQGSSNFTNVTEFENWIKQAAQSQSLKLSAITNKSIGSEANFNKYEVATTFNGSIENCSNFLRRLSSDGVQLKIHKLNLSAADQRTFSSSRYQLKIILELFV